MSNWTTVKSIEVEVVKPKPHIWKHRKVMHWEYCFRCGLIAVNNAPTRKLVRKLCGTFWLLA